MTGTKHLLKQQTQVAKQDKNNKTKKHESNMSFEKGGGGWGRDLERKK